MHQTESGFHADVRNLLSLYLENFPNYVGKIGKIWMWRKKLYNVIMEDMEV